MKSKNISINDKKRVNIQRNLGIEILRAYLCFRIVLLHYYSSNNKYILSLKRNHFQVPCFFFISFYFLYPTISQRNYKKAKSRLERLLIPYLIHPIINWIINNVMFLLIRFNRYNRLLTLNDLKTQIIVGRGIYGIAVLWFHFNLIIFTIFFFLLSYALKNYFLLFFQITAIISYKFQYSGINYLFFKKYTENIWMSVGNLIETFPLTICGFTCSSIRINQILIKKRKTYLFYSALILYLIFNYNIFSFIRGFSSPGIQEVFISFFLIIFFSLLPIELLNIKIILFLSQITKYTQGIYCMHFLFQYYMKLKVDRKGSFAGCIILYCISYCASFLGFMIFGKTKLKYLFN